MAVSAKEKKRT